MRTRPEVRFALLLHSASHGVGDASQNRQTPVDLIRGLSDGTADLDGDGRVAGEPGARGFANDSVGFGPCPCAGGANARHRGDPAADTSDFSDASAGNLRVDDVLPSGDRKVLGGGGFWPAATDPLSRLTAMTPVATSDYRLVYLDVSRP